MAAQAPVRPPLKGVAHLWRAQSYGPSTPVAGGRAFHRGVGNYPVVTGGGPATARGRAYATDLDATQLLQACLAALSAAGGLIHLAAAVSHFGVSPLHGAFFIGTGLFQLATAALLAYRSSSWVLAATALGNALVLAIWVMSRTTGIPIEPEAWTPEPVGIADSVASLLELVLVTGSAVLLVPSARSSLESSSPKLRGRAVPAASVLLLLTGPALFTAGGSGHSHSASAHAGTEVHSQGEVHMVPKQAMAGAVERSGSTPLPAAPANPASADASTMVQTRPAVVPPPPAEIVAPDPPPVASQPEQAHPNEQPHPHEGEQHTGHQ